MKTPIVVLFILLLAVNESIAAVPSVSSKMRPYTGIGVLVLPVVTDDPSNPRPLYEEPGLSRLGSLDPGKLPKYEWIFGALPASIPLIVMGQKGSWLRVVYDDAGREAWFNAAKLSTFQPWEFFLKDRVIRLLPELQNKYYRLYQRPGKVVLATLASGRFLKVLQMENDWAMVLSEQNSLGWVRWRDEDGRLLIGVCSAPQVMQP